MAPIVLHAVLPPIQHFYRRIVRKTFVITLGCVILSSICNQLSSTFAFRPLAAFYDLRLQAVLVIQLTGFGLCLYLSFVYGVAYAFGHAAIMPRLESRVE